MAFSTGLAGTIDTRSAVQCLHFQSSIVSEALYVILVEDVLSFHQGILLQRHACLRDVLVTADVGQRYHFKLIAQYLSDLFQFVLVVGCEYYSLHSSVA